MMDPNRDYSLIPGWGIDADPDNDPARPMKRRVSGEHEGYSWERPRQQPDDKIEVLHSNERPNLSAVFGTSTPPSGLSGTLRRFAFRFSESSYGHWLPLMLADRVDEVEGLANDVAGGHLPNVCAERGWGAEWKHNRAAFTGRLLLGAVLLSAAFILLSSRRERHSARERRW